MAVRSIVIFACVLVGCVLAHPFYRDRIPNGYFVPNPCPGPAIWEPVGHYDPQHHTQLKNKFAQAFAANGHTWTATLCNQDSDGDGQTNGQELGDPFCAWTVGSTPALAATGHPGICEPVGSASCAHDAFYCGCHGSSCTG